MIRAAILFAYLALSQVVAGDAASAGPHQGNVIVGLGANEVRANVWILEETSDGIKHTLNDKPDGPQTAIARGKYLRVEYRTPNEVSWIKAEGAVSRGKFDEAAISFTEAATTGKTWYIREAGLLRAADCWIKAGKAEQALKSLETMRATFPKHARQGDALYLQGEALAKSGDRPGAIKVFTELSKRSELGLDAVVLGTLGQAQQYAADKKFAEAAAALSGVFAKLDADRDVRMFGQIGAELAGQLIAAGQSEPAIAVLRRLAYGVTNPTIKAKAHVDWAQMLTEVGDAKSLFLAFDHAAIASVLRDADQVIAERAWATLRQLSAKIDKLPADQCSDAEKAEYRRYLTR